MPGKENFSKPQADRANIDPQSVADRAEFLFQNHWNCAEAVFQACCEACGVNTPVFLATGLGGGVGNGRRMCGALTGAVLSLGLRYGRETCDGEIKHRCYDKTMELVDDFRTRFHSTNCWELSETLQHTPATKSICDKFVHAAAMKAAELLKEESPNP